MANILLVEDEEKIARFIRLELEHEGYVQSIPGKGCFAHKQITGDPKRMDGLWEALERTVSELRFLGVTTEELIARIEGGKRND